MEEKKTLNEGLENITEMNAGNQSETPTGIVLMSAEKIKDEAVKALQSKKAGNVCVVDVTKLTTVARFFVIATANTPVHAKALADIVDEALQKTGNRAFRRSGYETGRWVLLDYSEVIVHVLCEEERKYYDLERLWRNGIVTYPADEA